LSPASAIAGTSGRQGVRRICLARSGRKGGTGGGRHAEHVAEVRAGGDVDVLERVGEGDAPLFDAAAEDLQAGPEQDEVGRLAGDVHGPLDGDADVGIVEGRGIVDAVAQVADDVSGLLEGPDDALLLVGIDLGEEGRVLDAMPQGFGRVALGPGHDAFDRGHDVGDVGGHAAVSPVMILRRMPSPGPRSSGASARGGSKKEKPAVKPVVVAGRQAALT
jgi:hypothetical protein